MVYGKGRIKIHFINVEGKMADYTCAKEGIISELKTDVKNIKEDVSDLNKIYELMYQMTANVSVLTEQMSSTKIDVQTIKKDVEEIKVKPLETKNSRFNMILDKVIATIITVVVTAITIGILSPIFREGLM